MTRQDAQLSVAGSQVKTQVSWTGDFINWMQGLETHSFPPSLLIRGVSVTVGGKPLLFKACPGFFPFSKSTYSCPLNQAVKWGPLFKKWVYDRAVQHTTDCVETVTRENESELCESTGDQSKGRKGERALCKSPKSDLTNWLILQNMSFNCICLHIAHTWCLAEQICN